MTISTPTHPTKGGLRHIAIAAVGKRTEHWSDLFRALLGVGAVRLSVYVADVSPLAQQELAKLAASDDRFRYSLLPHHFGEDRTGHMASIVLSQRALTRAATGHRPDVLHIIGEAAYLSTYQLLRFRNTRWPGVPGTLYAAQNVPTRFPRPFPQLERYAYRNVQSIFPITPAADEVIHHKGYIGASRIVPLGVDRTLFKPRYEPPSDPFTAGFVGRLEKHKGIVQLLSAVRMADCRLHVVGDGSLRPLVEAEQRARPGMVELTPWVTHQELPQHLARMHVLTLPSIPIIQRNVLPWVGVPLREQFGRVLVEAMACGVPVVASAVGEIPHVVGDAGLLVPTAEASHLATALRHLRDQPDLADRLSCNGLLRAAAFDWRVVAKCMLDAWQELVDTPGRHRRDSAPLERSPPRTSEPLPETETRIAVDDMRSLADETGHRRWQSPPTA
jgi:glycosyltransferase involved in cell wall biosynthesis